MKKVLAVVAVVPLAMGGMALTATSASAESVTKTATTATARVHTEISHEISGNRFVVTVPNGGWDGLALVHLKQRHADGGVSNLVTINGWGFWGSPTHTQHITKVVSRNNNGRASHEYVFRYHNPPTGEASMRFEEITYNYVAGPLGPIPFPHVLVNEEVARWPV